MCKKNLLKFSLICVFMIAINAFAEEYELDATTGPGVGLVGNTKEGFIYDTAVTDEKGNLIMETVKNDIGPTTINQQIVNPIDNYAIDMGPTTNNYNYIRDAHSINDNGPGGKITQDMFITNPVYGGGPGGTIKTSTISEFAPQYKDYTTMNVTPDNLIKNMGPTTGEVAISKKEK